VDWNLILLALILLLTAVLLHRLGRYCQAAARVDWGVGWMNRLDGCNRLFCRHYHRLESVSLPIPETGPAVVVANHISGLDPLLMMASSRRRLRFLVAAEQYNRFGLRWLFRAIGCIPVDRQGAPEKALRAAISALREGDVVALFPHGKIHLSSDPPRRIKAGAVRLAFYAQAPLIPLTIHGVKRQGHVVSPILLRARARLTRFEPIYPLEMEAETMLKRLQGLLDS
jgi:1-acyl-sn-glycerol-3-phosphate acyltransferase